MGRGKRREPFFSLSPSHRASRALFFFLPSLPTTQRGFCAGWAGERFCSHIASIAMVAEHFFGDHIDPSRHMETSTKDT